MNHVFFPMAMPVTQLVSHHSQTLGKAGATIPVGQVSTGPLFSPSALTADLGDYDVRGSIDERSTGSTELAA